MECLDQTKIITNGLKSHFLTLYWYHKSNFSQLGIQQNTTRILMSGVAIGAVEFANEGCKIQDKKLVLLNCHLSNWEKNLITGN